MTTIESIKASINEQIDHAKVKVEALKLQASLGKAELNDAIEQKRIEAAKSAADLRDHLKEIGVSAGEALEHLNAKVDNLSVQVALGKMESKDAVQQAKDKVTQYAHQFESALEQAGKVEEEKLAKVKEKFAHYMTKMSELKASLEAKIESYKL